jgi:hypothetical protein
MAVRVEAGLEAIVKIREAGVVAGNHEREWETAGAKRFHRMDRARTRMVDPAWLCFDVRIRVACADVRLKVGRVFSQVVQEAREVSPFSCAPGLCKPPRSLAGAPEVILEAMPPLLRLVLQRVRECHSLPHSLETGFRGAFQPSTEFFRAYRLPRLVPSQIPLPSPWGLAARRDRRRGTGGVT